MPRRHSERQNGSGNDKSLRYGNLCGEEKDLSEKNRSYHVCDKINIKDSQVLETLGLSTDIVGYSPCQSSHQLYETKRRASYSSGSVRNSVSQNLYPEDLYNYNSRADNRTISSRPSIDYGGAISTRHSSVDNRVMSTGQSISETQTFDILIVDDSGLSRKMLIRLLRASGFTFDEAEDGLIAVDKVKARMSPPPPPSPYVTNRGAVRDKDHYDVIFMDFVMPKMDGPTATKAIRALGYAAPIFGN